MRITDVVKHLLIINVLVYFGSMLLIGDRATSILGLYYPTAEGYFKPYQFVTHMFMHGSDMHLLFNMIGLFFFGPPPEATWGPKRFLFYYLFTGFGAMALYLLVKTFELYYLGANPNIIYIPMVGASGAIFGLLVAYGMLFPNNIVSLIFPPISMKAKYFVLIYAGIELFMGVGSTARGGMGGVAHFAHLGGAISGALLILYWRRFGSRL